jgi:ring-1,2-phenylacetyl-CoA epoxidase subunit PaaD
MLAEMQYLQRAYPGSSGKEVAMQRLVDIAPAEIPQIWALLSQIPDPEVPVLTITDLRHGAQRGAQGEGDWLYANLFGLPGDGTPAGEIRATMTRTALPRCISSCSLTRRGPPTG